MSRAGTLWRTVSHLKPIQVWGRLRHHLHRPVPNLRPAPALRQRVPGWMQAAQRSASLIGETRFRFLNEEHDLADHGWDDPQLARLWRYNLHYFDDLNAHGFALRRVSHSNLIDCWITSNPPARGTAWEPYPISLRIVNWIKWQLGGASLREVWLHSLAVQARWLACQIEWHLLGNHLFVNAKALVFAGLFFEGAEADTWLHAGLRIVERELPEQILHDGGHFERSPMYHALALEDLLDLLNVAACYPHAAVDASLIQQLRQKAAAMLFWLRCMCHPDQEIAFFNDAAIGVAPSVVEIESYAARLGVQADAPPQAGVTSFPESGYVRVARGVVTALLDAAPLGPDYLLGHAHADTLSFELSVGLQRLIVNGGTSCYGLGERRLHERGTAWHSTVEVAGGDSSEVWSGFRVGRRARIKHKEVRDWMIEASHDGYRFLPGCPKHQRRWSFLENELLVEDFVLGGNHAAVARFHLAPGLSVDQANGASSWIVRKSDSVLAHINVEVGRGHVVWSEHAPQFGLLLPSKTLEVDLHEGHACTRWTWNNHAHPVSD